MSRSPLFSAFQRAVCGAMLVFSWSIAQGQDIVPTGPADSSELESDIPDVEPVPVEEPYRPDYRPSPVEPVQKREIGARQWQEATERLDYSDDLPEPVKQRRTVNPDFSSSDWNQSTAGIGKLLQIIAVVLALAGIAYAIYRTLQAPRNRQIGQAFDGTVITIDNVDAYIHETDLERFLREALAQGNYALAVRLYYLQIIKTLSEKGAIRWSREKTNRDYLRETRDHPQARAFREATMTFERIWYGNQSIDARGYSALEPQFRNLLSQI